MSDDFLDILDGPKRPEPQYATTPLDRDATAYALAALQGEIANLLAVPIGQGRNDQLNKSAVKMGGLIAAGAIDEQTVTEALGAADGGLDYKATRDTIRSGLDYGMSRARAIPDRTSTWSESAGRAIGGPPSDDPFNSNYVMPGADFAAMPVSPSGPMMTAGPSNTAATAATLSELAVKAEVATQRVRRDARRILDAEDVVKTFRIPPFELTLTDELRLPDEPITYAIDQILPTGGNALLTAAFKTGKTTLINNLTRALADGQPFLGRFTVPPLLGRVALFNYEVDASQYRRWLRDVGIQNTDHVVVLNLRGFRVPILTPHVEDWVVAWLAERDVSMWIVDPFARAITGSVKDENDNTEVGRFLDTLDVIKSRAGVAELVLPTHTGRQEFEAGAERARGATRLDDWADVRWMLNKDDEDNRYFSATGRDVDLPEEKLTYAEESRGYVIGGGDRKWVKKRTLEEAIIAAVNASPGISLRSLREVVGGNRERTTDSIRAVAARREIVIEGGPNRTQLHYPAGHVISTQTECAP